MSSARCLPATESATGALPAPLKALQPDRVERLVCEFSRSELRKLATGRQSEESEQVGAYLRRPSWSTGAQSGPASKPALHVRRSAERE